MSATIRPGLIGLVVLVFPVATSRAAPMGTAFSFQGQLKDAGIPANGPHDFAFTLWDAEADGNMVAGPVQVTSLDVVSGTFKAQIDFGAAPFNGNAVWLQVAVGLPGESLTKLSPRQQITATPYALHTRGIVVDENLNMGIGTTAPLARQHIEGADLSLSAAAFLNEDLAIEDADAVLGLYSDLGGDWGSALSLGEVDASGNLVDKWTIARRASNAPGGSALRFTYGPDANYSANATVMHLASSGRVGIGTTTPEATLDLNGEMIHRGGALKHLGHDLIIADASRGDGGRALVHEGDGVNERLVLNFANDFNQGTVVHGNLGIGKTPNAKLDIAGGDIHLDADRELLFADNGQIRSHDDNHRILFRREDNMLEFREWGDIVLSAGATAGEETASVVIKASGNMGIGTANPSSKLDVAHQAGTAINGETTGNIAVRGVATASGSGTTYGGYFEAYSMEGRGVAGAVSGAQGAGVYAVAVGTDGTNHGVGLRAESTYGKAVDALTKSNSTDAWSPAVYGRNEGAGDGVYGWSQNRYGTVGVTSSADPNIAAVWAKNNGAGAGLLAEAGSGGYAAVFNGWIRTHVVEITGGSDLSEKFDITAGKDRVVVPGMVVCIDPDNPGGLAICTQPYDRTVAGIVSGAGGIAPGMLMGQQDSMADGAKAVALSGRVYCLVDSTNGAVEPGDLLTTSSTPGHARKVTDHTRAHGAILGKAMTGLREGKGLVLVLVTLQ